MKISRDNRRLIKVKEWGLDLSELCPGLTPDTKVMLRTDENGFIKTGNHSVNGESICILGDSFAECIRVQEKHRFPSVTERVLRNAGHNVNILNAAMSGANTLQLTLILLIKCVALNIHRAIFVIPSIDHMIASFKNGYFNNDSRGSLFYNTNKSEKRLPFDFLRTKYREVLLLFINTCKIYNIHLIIATHPYKLKNDARNKMNEIVIDIAGKENIPIIDFRKQFETNSSEYFYDNLHLNEAGSILYGKRLGQHLLKYNLI